MFALNLNVDGLKIPAIATVKAATKAQREKSPVAANLSDALREYLALLGTESAIAGDLKARAFALLKDAKDTAAVEVVRKAFVAAYAFDYKARYPQNTEAQMIGARDVAWARVKKNAVDGGWVSPANKGKTNTDKKPHAAKGKPSNNKGKGKAQTVKAASAVEVMQSAIVEMKKFDTDLSVALDWVRASNDNREAFLAWFKAQKAAQLAPVAKAA